MSEAPEMQTILQIVSAIDNGIASGARPEVLMEQVLPLLRAHFGAESDIRFYRLVGHQLVYWPINGENDASPADDRLALDEHPAYVKALEGGTITYMAEAGTLIAPLKTGEFDIGVLTITGEDTPEHRAALKMLGSHLGLALGNLIVRDLIGRQTAAAHQLREGQTLEEFASAIARNMLKPRQFVSINLFHFSEDQFQGIRTLVTANRHESHVLDEKEAILILQEDDLGDIERVYFDAQPVYINNIAQRAISDNTKQWLIAQHIQSLYLIPMRVEGHTYGFVAINGLDPNLDITPAESQALQALTDQVSALIRVHNLAQTATYAQTISARQALAFNQLAVGQDFATMAKIIARYMLIEQGRFIAINTIDYDEVGRAAGWTVKVSANREGAFTDEMRFEINWNALPEVFQRAIENGEPFNITNVETFGLEAFSPQMLAYFKENDIRSIFNVPITISGRVGAILSVVSQQLTSFTPEEMNAYTNLADQISALLDVQESLQEAAQARDLAENLVLASRLVTAAVDYPYMAQAVLYTIARDSKGIAITLFDRQLEVDELPNSRHCLTLHTQAAYYTEEELPTDFLAELPDEKTILQMMRGQPIYYTSLRNDNTFNETTRARAEELGANGMMIIGLRAGGLLLGTLNIFTEGAPDYDEDQVEALTTLADQIGISVQTRQLLEATSEAREQAEKLVETNRAITMAFDEAEMLQAVMGGMPSFVDATVLLLFDRPIYAGQLPQTIITRAIATRETVKTVEIVDTPDLSNEKARDALKQIMEGQVFIIEDFDDYQSLMTPNSIGEMKKLGMKSAVSVGLRSGNQLRGLLSFGAFDTLQLALYPTGNFLALADQIAITLENRELLEQTQSSLEEAGTLYEVNRALVQSQTPADVLRALQRYIAFDADLISFSTLEYNAQGEITDLVTVARIRGNTVIDEPIRLSEGVGEASIAAYTAYLDQLPENVLIVEDAGDDEENTMQQVLGEGSYIVFVLRSGKRVTDIVSILYDTPRQFSNQQRRLYQSIYSQIGIVIDNQRLLRDSQTAAARLAEQVQVLRAMNELAVTLSAARDKETILAQASEALVRSLNIDHVGIAIVQPDGETMIVEGEYPPQGVIGTVVSSTEDDIQKIIRKKGEPAVINDLPNSDLFVSNRDILENIGIQSIAVLPLLDHNNEFIGTVGLDITAPDKRFQPEMIETARTITAQLAISLQNLRLLERTQKDAQRLEEQVRVLNAINDVSNTLNQVRDTEELVKQVTKALVEVLQIDHAGIVLINPDRKTGTVAGEYPDKGATGFTLSAKGELWDKLRNKESIVINDVDHAEGLPEGSREALQATGVKSVMFVPLQDIDGSLLGSVGLDIYRPKYPFTPRMAEIAETITSQVAIGLQNINLFTSTQRYARQLEIIARFNQSIEATSSAREIYLQALKTLGDMVEANHAAIYLYHEDRDHLHTIALLAEGKQSVDMVSGEIYSLDGILGAVWDKGTTVYIEDMRDEQLDFQVDSEVQALMIAPLKVGNKAIGLVSLGAYESYVYQQTDLAVFRQFVNQIGVAIENAEAYAKSERTALSKTMANEISALIQQQVDLNSILQVTMGELGRALHAKRGRIRLGAQAIDASDGKAPNSNGDNAT